MRIRWIVIGLVLVAVAAVVVWQMLEPDAVVYVIQPTHQTIREFVEDQAVTELPRDYLIATPIAGWLEPIELREGDPVSEGQIVARLEASRAVMEFAESEVERVRRLQETAAAAPREPREAETQVRRSRADYQSDALRVAALKTLAAVSYLGPKFITDYIDQKSYDVQTDEQQKQQARAELQIARRNLERASIASPIDGVVLARHQTRRQYLPGRGAASHAGAARGHGGHCRGAHGEGDADCPRKSRGGLRRSLRSTHIVGQSPACLSGRLRGDQFAGGGAAAG